MTRLLVSVRSLDEAIDAFEAGADLIDLKEPAAGSLGRVSSVVAIEVARQLGSRVPVSMALGELTGIGGKAYLASPAGHSDADGIPAGVCFAKLGLSGCAIIDDWPSRWAAAVARLPASCAPVAVIYADWQSARAPSPEAVLAQAVSVGCSALLIDTFSKEAGALFEHLPPSHIARLVKFARLQGLVTVLAGSLTLATAPLALQLHPDYLAVRGAVCEGSRVARLMPAKVRQWKTIVDAAAGPKLACGANSRY